MVQHCLSPMACTNLHCGLTLVCVFASTLRFNAPLHCTFLLYAQSIDSVPAQSVLFGSAVPSLTALFHSAHTYIFAPFLKLAMLHACMCSQASRRRPGLDYTVALCPLWAISAYTGQISSSFSGCTLLKVFSEVEFTFHLLRLLAGVTLRGRCAHRRRLSDCSSGV